MKKLKSVLLPIVLMSLIFAGCETTKNVSAKLDLPKSFQVEKLNPKTVPLYVGDGDEPVDEIEILIPVSKDTKKEIEEIPYVDVAKFLTFWNTAYYDEPLSTKTEKLSSTKVKIYRTEANTYGITFDSQAQTIYFPDYDAALRKTDEAPLIDLSGGGKYLKNTSNNFNRYGKYMTVDLGKYGIQMIIQDGNVYIPLSTFCTLFETYFTYNKSGVFSQHSVASTKFFDENSGKNDRSEELTYFNYRDLCFALDFLYGLKDTHGINDFHDYLCETGLIAKFLGSAEDSVDGLYEMTMTYFADLHSAFKVPSYYCGNAKFATSTPYTPEGYTYNPSILNYIKTMLRNQATRASIWEAKKYNVHMSPVTQSVNDYYVVGDTAFITFDQFFADDSVDYYELTENGKKELAYENVCDTIGLVIYAHQQIKKNPAIKNVVIDDSLNGGGMATALLYIEAWMLGETPFSARNIVSGGMCTASYMADVNMDGEYTIEDSLPGLGRNLNLFCVTSPASFSCGNGLPAALKESGMVTILGMKSGGGACVVRNLYSADSAFYQISGPIQLCTVKNGAFYQVDEGVEPDYAITDMRVVYDREELASFIKNRVLYSK